MDKNAPMAAVHCNHAECGLFGPPYKSEAVHSTYSPKVGHLTPRRTENNHLI